MKLICLHPIPHGLKHLAVGDVFEEPDARLAEMLIHIGRAKPAEQKAATYQTRDMVAAGTAPTPAVATVTPPVVDAAPTPSDAQDADAQPKDTGGDQAAGSDDAPSARAKRTYTRKTAT